MAAYLIKINLKNPIKPYLTRLSIFTDSCFILHGKLRGIVIDVKDSDGYIASPNLCWILYRKRSQQNNQEELLASYSLGQYGFHLHSSFAYTC